MRTIFVGDIHGCAEEFSDLLKAVGFAKDSDRLLLTGDAFTKGPDPLSVWRMIGECRAEMVMGNHDAELLTGLKSRLSGKSGGLKPNQLRSLDALMPVVADVMSWIEALPLYIEEKDFLLVHAGINPERELAGTSRDEFLAIRTWPPVKGIEGPRWHDAYRPIRPLLIFGHDAPGGLVEKRRADGSPCVIGLDTGCVYGHCLSAYILEEDRIAQVYSRQPRVFSTG